MKIVIIGGVAGGASAAARLRRLDENAEIVVLEKGDHISYANCGLPYYIGGEITDKNALTLQTPQSFFNRFFIDVRPNNEAVSIDRDKKIVSIKNLKDGAVYEESYDKLILSPGAEPIRPNVEGIDERCIFTLRNIPDTYKISEYIDQTDAKTAVVVGGGAIGVEMAENLLKAGLKVTIVELASHLIAPLDFDMACDVHHYLKSKGIDLRLGNGVRGFEKSGDGVFVKLNDEKIYADIVIMSVGVKPDTKLAVNAGIMTNERGAILVGDNMITSDENIYAVGDAIEIKNFVSGERGYIPLAGAANKQGRIAADNICGIESSYKGTQGSMVLKIFDMTVASTGLNERAAFDIDHEKVYTFSSSHATYYPGATNMSLKLIFEKKTGRILGAQIVGFNGVDKRCDVIATAIRAGMSIYDLTELDLCYSPPFSSAKDPVNMAGFVAENLLTGLVRQFYWSNVKDLVERDDITLLDVRTKSEYENGHIKNAINIPVDVLRKNIDELDKSKPVFVNCQSGLRSYIACRILSQNGFVCSNLAGGYRLYNSVMRV